MKEITKIKTLRLLENINRSIDMNIYKIDEDPLSINIKLYGKYENFSITIFIEENYTEFNIFVMSNIKKCIDSFKVNNINDLRKVLLCLHSSRNDIYEIKTNEIIEKFRYEYKSEYEYIPESERDAINEEFRRQYEYDSDFEDDDFYRL